MPETDNGIRETLDLAHITAAAKLAAACVKARGVARVELTPGDRTTYEITLIAPITPIVASTGRVRTDVELRYRRDGLVSLLGGDTYPWPRLHLDSSYCAEKWGRDSSWTGVVVCEFLNAVHDALEENAPEGPP